MASASDLINGFQVMLFQRLESFFCLLGLCFFISLEGPILEQSLLLYPSCRLTRPVCSGTFGDCTNVILIGYDGTRNFIEV